MPLVFVPTPLGNLRDVTLRALDTLRDADVIVAEDTRVARKLLAALGLPGRSIWSYREQNAASATAGILERARTALVAVTSDAGMPGISDPGCALVAAAREAGVEVEVLPGPSASLGLALLSGFPLERFAFEGFPPRSAGARRAAFARALEAGATTLWYESPQRIRGTLQDLAAVAPDAAVFLLREYTKMHEERLSGTPAEVAAALAESVRGEVAFAVAPYRAAERGEDADPNAFEDAIDALLASGHRVGDIRKALYARADARKAGAKQARKAADS
ncbi:MAG: 16S rRNA (cytidine(1402)-2'-O)-methyltransferase [Candidatus Eremiobacteraeota bacterium]|nr:16S rRNA (cytidine(1402)-2'-O)-methyltransferase [Candidatus Eremiobacteraeota bacterium]